ncbi:MAG: hypothetical protein MOGMAGMI_01511 [Candidatus Omnitrophica bacterium]|nr:hypothetical protein [Candidatus Omnitrophota bacterium]
MKDLRPYLQVNRKISGLLTRFLARTGVSPNFVTTLALLCGVFAGATVSFGTQTCLLLGVAWLHLSFLLDNCDGELARLRDWRTRFGKWYDLFSDLLVDLSLWTGAYFGVRHYAMFRDFPAEELYVAAVLGSILHALIVVRERAVGCSTSYHADGVSEGRKKSLFFSFLDTLSHNGDSIVLAWLAVLTLNVAGFLAVGAGYINILWITRLVTNWERLTGWSSGRTLLWAGKSAALGLGLWLFWSALKGVTWSEVGGLLSKGGLGLGLVMLVFPLTGLLYTLGLYDLFPERTRRSIPFGRLYGIFLAGDSFNKITPFVDIGGEPLKVLLVYKKGLATLEESVRAICFARLVYATSEILVVLVALGIVLARGADAAILWVGGAATVFSVIYVGLLWGSGQGLAKLLPGMAARIGSSLSDEEVARLKGFMGLELRSLLNERRGDLLRSSMWHALGWTAFLLEVYFVFRIFGVEITLTQAFVIQQVMQAVQTVTFFIPHNLGAQEQGLAYLAAYSSGSAAHGIALSLVKRLRQVLYAALAAPYLYTIFSKRRPLSGSSGTVRDRS